ncbi:hypothetical protein SmJEL517_g05909 [Synchytrium microbalum]|uniref:TLC domain-containing protein n=1 Tax=Synchytrium microbalum TaxID=1806994 RepID=A0A507BT63_9FUNG|nr:uncharacterized protein SmJEL517_g05909 [Synchytrium microbalum]TPX30548.1 hypothetical protein SmJEL517_g05909 [Synchytrium microbalum]
MHRRLSLLINEDWFLSTIAYCALAQFIIFFGLVYAPWTKQYFNTVKKQAWILTLTTSAVMTFGSLPLLIPFLMGRYRVNELPLLDSEYSIVLSVYFVTYLLADLFIGSIYYKSLIDPLSGWFHHSLYTTVVVLLIRHRVSGAFILAGILELPTLLLAMGQINKKLRQDLVFGGAFFMTRIVLHVYLGIRLYTDFQSWQHWIAVGIFPLHAVWFSNWVKQQVRLRSQGHSSKHHAAATPATNHTNDSDSPNTKTSLKASPMNGHFKTRHISSSTAAAAAASPDTMRRNSWRPHNSEEDDADVMLMASKAAHGKSNSRAETPAAAGGGRNRRPSQQGNDFRSSPIEVM